jgi:hypothetical protein
MTISDRTVIPSRISIRVGFWSALLIAIAFLIFTVCFVAIAMTPPLFIWTNLANYVLFANQRSQLLQDVARAAMLLFGPLYVVLLNCIYDHTPVEKRLWARLGINFGLAFAVLTGINYFTQLSAVRLSLLKDELQGLEQIVQANPISGISAINMLGWTLFLGLSSLFIAPVFSDSKLAKAIRIAFLVNGLCCILGGIGYVFDNITLIFLTINFGMGGAVLTAAILLCIFYRKLMAPTTH